MFVYTIKPVVNPVVKPVVKPVWQPVWQPAVSYIQPVVQLGCTTRFDKLDNRLYRVNGVLVLCSFNAPYVGRLGEEIAGDFGYLVLWSIIATTNSCIQSAADTMLFIIRFEARLQRSIGFTLRRVLTVFTRSAITPSKVNRLGWNLEHSEYIVWGWPWRILGVICTVATCGEWSQFLFFLSGK